MSVTVHQLPPTAENISRATIGEKAHLDSPARGARHYVKLYRDQRGYFIVDRWKRRRYAKSVRVLAIDGRLLNGGTLVLEEGK